MERRSAEQNENKPEGHMLEVFISPVEVCAIECMIVFNINSHTIINMTALNRL